VGAGAVAAQLGSRQARESIAEAIGFDKPNRVHIKSISTGMGGEAVVEATVETAFHLGRDKSGKWVVKEVRTGDRTWESIELVATAVRKEKILRTAADMRTLATALEAYRRETGSYVAAQDGRGLVDALAPAYLGAVLRLDAWSNEFDYKGNGNKYRLASRGPDGKPDSDDDIVFENGAMVTGG
jgi:hypothetical protein